MSFDGWRDISIGEIVKIKHGWSFKGELFSEELTGRPIVVNIGNFQYTGGFRFESTTLREYIANYPKEFELKPADILLVMTCQTEGGEILGIPGRIPDDGRIYLHNQRMGKVEYLQPDLVSPNFIYWVFLWKDFNQHLVETASGTKILHTAPVRIESFRFSLPPKNEQEKIARILDVLNDKIELNRRMNHTLEEMARALFKSWFVDFDPVTAKAEGRVPFGMNAKTASLFPAEFEETGDEYFSEIPKGWSLRNLDDVADYENGLALQKFRPTGNKSLPAIKIRELRQGFADESSDRVSPNIKASCILEDGDVVFSWSGSLMIDLWCGGKGALNQHLFKVISEKYPKWFYYFWTEHHLVDFQDIAEGKATTMGHIQRHHITSAKVVVPSDEVLKKADKVFQPLLNSIIKNRTQIKTLATIRDALLPKLLSGELRVKS